MLLSVGPIRLLNTGEQKTLNEEDPEDKASSYEMGPWLPGRFFFLSTFYH